MWKEYHRSVGVPGTDTELDDFSWCGPDDHPAVHVLWDEIMDPGGFCEWASGVAGFTLTIPTDVQWEYAARGGLDGLEYPWGNEFDESKLWFYNEETAAVDRTDRIFRNGYGLTDMVGNVHQWCADYYNEEYRPSGRDPIDRRRSEYRCVRGGSWNDSYPLSFFRCALRFNYFPGGYIDFPIGFRLSAGPG
jgi:formylglycine-generating enzyme required for sulfatase activity